MSASARKCAQAARQGRRTSPSSPPLGCHGQPQVGPPLIISNERRPAACPGHERLAAAPYHLSSRPAAGAHSPDKTRAEPPTCLSGWYFHVLSTSCPTHMRHRIASHIAPKICSEIHYFVQGSVNGRKIHVYGHARITKGAPIERARVAATTEKRVGRHEKRQKRGRHGRWPTAKQPRRKIPSRGRAKACSPTNRMPSGAEHHGECRWTASRKTKQAPRQERESRTHRVLGPRRLSKTNESKAREKKREEKRLFNVADSARPAVQFSRCSADHHHSSRLDQTERGTGTQT